MEPVWQQACFPRFYFYDVLRGLAALARWAEKSGRALPLAYDQVREIAAGLRSAFRLRCVRTCRDLCATMPGFNRRCTARGP